MLEIFQYLDSTRVTNCIVIPINSTALKASWSGPRSNSASFYSITVEQNGTEIASYRINIGESLEYEDQVLIIGELSPFTNYLVTVIAFFDGAPEIPFSVSQNTSAAGNKIRDT